MTIDVKETREQNLRFIIDHYYNGIDSRLSEILGKSPALISRIFTKDPKVKRSIGNKFAREIETKTGFPTDWLDKKHPKHIIQTKDFTIKEIPIVPKEILAHHNDIPSAISAARKQNFEFAYASGSYSNNAFAIKTSITEETDVLRAGTKLIFEPATTPFNRSLILIRLIDDQLPIFRQLLIDGHLSYLSPLIPGYPIIEFTSQAKILGVFAGADFSETKFYEEK